MSMAYIRKTYGVPAKRGMRVVTYRLCKGDWKLHKAGIITSASHYVFIDGKPHHPTYGLVYLGKAGEVLLDTREGKQECRP